MYGARSLHHGLPHEPLSCRLLSAVCRLPSICAHAQVPGVASSTLDWVWASESMAVSAVYWPLTVPAVSAPAGPAGWRLYNLPNADHPSDHLPIGAILRVKRAPVRGANGMAHVVHAAAAEAPEGSDAMPMPMPMHAAASSSSFGSAAASEGTPTTPTPDPAS